MKFQKLDAKSNNNKLKMISTIETYPIEQHASMMYTMEILFKVQKDIKKAYTMCYQKSVLNYNNFQLCTVAFYNKITEVQTEFQVNFINYMLFLKLFMLIIIFFNRYLSILTITV